MLWWWSLLGAAAVAAAAVKREEGLLASIAELPSTCREAAVGFESRGRRRRIVVVGHHRSSSQAAYAQLKVLRFLLGDAPLYQGWTNSSTAADLVVSSPDLHWNYEPSPSSTVRILSELAAPSWILNAVFHVHGSRRPARTPADCERSSNECAAAKALAKAEWLVTRDRLSADWIRHFEPSARVLGPAVDLTFLLPHDVDDQARAHLKKLPDDDDRRFYSLFLAASMSPKESQSTRHVVIAAVVEACGLRPRRRPVRLVVESRRSSYVQEDVARLVRSGICAEGSGTVTYARDSFSQTIELLKAQDLVITGSFHVACFARMASVPAIVLPGVDSALAEQLVELFDETMPTGKAPDYLAVPREELFSTNKMLVKNRVKAFFHGPRSSAADLALGLSNLRRLALANVGPFAQSCPDFFEPYFPTVATLDDLKDQEAFLAKVHAHNCTTADACLAYYYYYYY